MKKIFIIFMFLVSIFAFSMEKPDYLTDITESKYDKGEYTVKAKFERMITDDQTLKYNFIRLALSLKYAQEQHPKGKWFFVKLIDENGEEIHTPSIAEKLERLNLINENGKPDEIAKKVLYEGNVLCNIETKNDLKIIFN